MAELIVVGFKKDMYRASEVLNDLSRLNDDWVVDLHDAVAVYRDYEGKLRVDQSYQMTTGEGAGWGALWGLMIGVDPRDSLHCGSERSCGWRGCRHGGRQRDRHRCGARRRRCVVVEGRVRHSRRFRSAGRSLGPTG